MSDDTTLPWPDRRPDAPNDEAKHEAAVAALTRFWDAFVRSQEGDANPEVEDLQYLAYLALRQLGVPETLAVETGQGVAVVRFSLLPESELIEAQFLSTPSLELARE